jgi:PKD repeat protein
MRSLTRCFRDIALVILVAVILTPFAGRGYAADLTIYDDSLSSGWADWSWSITRNFTNGSPVHSGTKSVSVVFTSGWAGFSLHANTPANMNGYGWELRFWIYGNATGNQSLQVYVNGAGCGAAPVATVANSWTEVRIPLVDLGGPAELTDIAWQDTTGNPQTVFYLDDITVVKTQVSQQTPVAGPGLSINADSGNHPISADIYGMNYADEQLAAILRLPVRRWGGNSTSRYNWQTSMYNTGSDWYFENIPDGDNVTDGSASDLFVDQDRRTGTKTLMTVPLIGWTPRSDSSRDHPYACGFKVSKYGAQQSTDSWDSNCGNGVHTNGTNITGNDPTDTSKAVDHLFVTGWLNHLTGKYGTATNGGVAYYDLDNEPMLWNSTHRDVHPQATTYDEMRDRTYQYAAALKTSDSSAKTLGPVLWGWCAYFFSAVDECGAKNSDYNAHSQTYFVPWYLQQMKAYEDQYGVRILDYLDLHNYPAASNVSLSPGCSPVVQALRLRSTRSLWDTTYVDESWIASMGFDGGIVKLIPRMKAWVNANYPGTKLAITEYNWGGLDSINGALAQADVLGIFGREGLDLATIWGPPDSSQPGAFAFRIYRNYDGTGHGFGETGVQASSADQGKLSVYAARRSLDSALTVVVINKTGSDLSSTVNLYGINPLTSASVYRYTQADLTAIEHMADQPVTENGFSATFPANSITLFVIPAATGGDRTLTVSRTGSGAGTVTADPGTIIWNGKSGTASYPNGTDVTLAASPIAGSGSAFSGWSGECSGKPNPCSFSISADTEVSARFDLLTDFTVYPTTGPVPLYVCFTDTSNDNPASWLWNFGDGSTDVTHNPCHGYKAAGAYSVSLSTSGGGGGNTNTKNNYINASACINQPVRIEGNPSPFAKIQDALNNTLSGETIDLHALDFIENPSMTNGTSVTLIGGLGCDYLQTPLFTTIHGDLTIGSGALTLERIVIQ